MNIVEVALILGWFRVVSGLYFDDFIGLFELKLPEHLMALKNSSIHFKTLKQNNQQN